MDKILWKSGQMHIDDVKEDYFNLAQVKGGSGDKWKSPQAEQKIMLTRVIDK